MTNLYIDIETKGLNAKEFISGCIIYNKNPKTQKDVIKIFNNAKSMWNFIIEFGKTLFF